MNASGRHMHFNLCHGDCFGPNHTKCPWQYGPAIAQSWRTSPDHTWEWNSTKSVLDTRLRAIPADLAGGAFGWNDLDMLQTGNYGQMAAPGGQHGWGAQMTEVEYKTEFSMWAILASPLTVTTPLLNCSKTDQAHGDFTPGRCKPSLTDLQKEILFNSDILRVNQDVTPGGRLLAYADTDGGNRTMLIRRDLSDGSLAIALYNPTDSDALASVDFARHLGWAKPASAAVRDLWKRAEVGVFTDRFPSAAEGSVAVAAHATIVLRLSRV